MDADAHRDADVSEVKVVTIVFYYYANTVVVRFSTHTRRAAGGSQHHMARIECRALDGEPQLKPFSGYIELHCIERAAGDVKVEFFPERRYV